MTRWQAVIVNYVKIKQPWNPELVNTTREVLLTEIDDDGMVR